MSRRKKGGQARQAEKRAAKQTKARLLPPDLYPASLDEAARDRVDVRLRGRMHLIPLKPGPYLDKEGEPWLLGDDGSWTDKLGETRDKSYRPILAAFGPFTPFTKPVEGETGTAGTDAEPDASDESES